MIVLQLVLQLAHQWYSFFCVYNSTSDIIIQAPVCARHLVRRVTGPGPHDSPVMMAASTPVTTHPHFQDQLFNGPGPYSPRVEAHYGRGDGTFRQDWRYREAERMSQFLAALLFCC